MPPARGKFDSQSTCGQEEGSGCHLGARKPVRTQNKQLWSDAAWQAAELWQWKFVQTTAYAEEWLVSVNVSVKSKQALECRTLCLKE